MTLDPMVWGFLYELPPPAAPRAVDPDPPIVTADGAPSGIPGVRLFNVRAGRLTGIGAGRGHVWSAGMNEAVCVARKTVRGACVPPTRRHTPAHAHCTCGFYALTRVDMLPSCVGDYVVCGVAGYGRVQLHQHGWRAQYAEVLFVVEMGPHAGVVVESDPSSWCPPANGRIADDYRVPVISLARCSEWLEG